MLHQFVRFPKSGMKRWLYPIRTKAPEAAAADWISASSHRTDPARLFNKDMFPSLHSPECEGAKAAFAAATMTTSTSGSYKTVSRSVGWRTVRRLGSKVPRAFLVQIARIFQRTGWKRAETSLANQAATDDCKTGFRWYSIPGN